MRYLALLTAKRVSKFVPYGIWTPWETTDGEIQRDRRARVADEGNGRRMELGLGVI